MSKTPKSVRLDKHQEDAIGDMTDRGVADNDTEALKQFLNAGMAEYGYEHGHRRSNPLATIAAEFARAFAWIGVGWLALTWLLPIEFRVGAIFALLASLGSLGVKHIAEEYDIGVDKTLVGGEKA